MRWWAKLVSPNATRLILLARLLTVIWSRVSGNLEGWGCDVGDMSSWCHLVILSARCWPYRSASC
jgi:hypothetical protein